jgi:hypothetical protein
MYSTRNGTRNYTSNHFIVHGACFERWFFFFFTDISRVVFDIRQTGFEITGFFEISITRIVVDLLASNIYRHSL